VRPKSQNKKNHSGRVFEITLIAVFIVVLMVILFQTIKITKGVAKVVETPSEIVRIQILFNSLQNEKADNIAEYLSNYKDAEINFEVVDKSLFTIRDINETIIINRTNNPEVSEKLADILGLDYDLIIQKILSENKKHISVTLVIGNDIEIILSKIIKDEE
jgi:hypothetical protein